MFKLTGLQESSHFGSSFRPRDARLVGLGKLHPLIQLNCSLYVSIFSVSFHPNLTCRVPYQFNQLPRFFIPADLTNLVSSFIVRTSLCVSFPSPSTDTAPHFSVDLTSFQPLLSDCHPSHYLSRTLLHRCSSLLTISALFLFLTLVVLTFRL